MAELIKYSKSHVPTDGSKSALYAGRHAVYLPKVLGAEVLAANVVDTNLAFRSGLRYAGEVSELEASGVKATVQIKALCDEAGVASREIIARGSPASVILKVAHNEPVGCIAIGTVGTSAMKRMLSGRVSSGVSHHAASPVLLVRAPVG